MKGTRRTIRAARRLYRLCLIDGRLDESRVRQVARRLGGSRRRGSIAVLSSLRRMVKLDRDRHRAVVETATGLPDDLRDEVQASLARVYGSGLATSFETSPGLIGGMRIRVGSDVYDGSVRARLAAIESRL
jgi:F-type H+-transporting ATPase subunit delta